MLELLEPLTSGLWTEVSTASTFVFEFLGSPATASFKSRAEVLVTLASVASGTLAVYGYAVQRPRRLKRIEHIEASRVAEINALRHQIGAISAALLDRQVAAIVSPVSSASLAETQRCINQAVADMSGHADSRCQTVLAAFRTGRLDQGEAMLRQLLDAKSAESKSAASLGAAAARTLAALHRLSDPARALAYYGQALELEPGHAQTVIDYRVTAEMAGQPIDAVAG